jgi:hypothetical protein
MVPAIMCYARRMESLPSIELPATPEGLRRFAMALWRIAPRRPTNAGRMLTLRRAQCLAGLARALDENPNLGKETPAA